MTTRRPLPPTPAAPVRPRVFHVHGQPVRDDYAWLKAPNWQEVLDDPKALPAEIRAHLDRENAYTSAVMAGTKALSRRLVKEMRARIREDDASVPEADGPFAYFTRYREGGQHPLVVRVPSTGGPEALLLDGDEEGRGHAFFDLGEAKHSPDHRLLAWSADIKGSEHFTIRIRNLATGCDLGERVPDTTGDLVWIGDASGFYYIELDDTHRPVRVRRHRLGAPPTTDEVVYEEHDPGFFLDIGMTQSRQFLVITASNHEMSEAWLVDRMAPAAAARRVEPRAPAVQYCVDHDGDRLVILTNADGAEDFKIVTAPVSAPERENWRDLVPHRPGTMILSHVTFARHLVRLEREDANPRIVVRETASGTEHAVAFREEAYALDIEPGLEFDTDIVRYCYSSPTTPEEVVDYNLRTGERTLRKRQEVPSGHNPDDYVTRRIFATAPDGAQVPVSILHRRDLPTDGSAPCQLEGYGAYGTSVPAEFCTNILSLVDRGFVYAIAHIRGGTEKGWGWYLDGKREKKTNTFTDFIACAEALIAAGYTAQGRIVAHGGSAGGMLMGAVANMAPDLFAGIVSEVPFVDVLNTMLDGELPLTPPEWPEWGNPGADEAAFRTILAYSPYDNVKAQAYPAILALGGLTDPRVTYWEPAKWVARLRATMTGGGPILLKLNMEAGHGGAAGRFDRLEEVALTYAFAMEAIDGFEGQSPLVESTKLV